jgi:hypothetical protein
MTEGTEGVSLELALDLRRLRFLKARLIRLAVVCEPAELSLSVLLESDDESDELELSMSARTPG